MTLTIEAKSGNSVANSNQHYKVHRVRKGDSLWKISKIELGKNATKTDIANYSNKIAKLNKLKNPNRIFRNTTLYLPDLPVENKKAVAVGSNKVNSVNKTNAAKNVSKPNKTSAKIVRAKTEAEKGFENFTNNITHGKNLRTEKSFFVPEIPTQLYHFYVSNDRGASRLVGSYQKDEKGNFECIVFNGPKKINSFGYDYILDRSGNIYKKSDYDLYGNNTSQKIPVVGRVSKAQMQQITKTLENQIENSNKK